MTSTREQAQHANGIGWVAGLAQNLTINNNDGVRAQNDVMRPVMKHRQGFFPRQAFRTSLRELSCLRRLRDIGGLYHEWNASIAEKLLTARGSRGENQHESLILDDQLGLIAC